MRIHRKQRLMLICLLIAFSCTVCWRNLFSFPIERSKRTKSQKTHIAYVKVHKAASSTVQNIFLRYGYSRNLTFVLGKRTNFYPQVISNFETVGMHNIEPPPEGKTRFDILCSHVIYDRRAFEAILPHDTFYVGIIREPFEHILSVIRYFRPHYIFENTEKDPVSAYMKNPKLVEPRLEYSFTNNRMSFEFGLPKKLFNERNSVLIQQELERLDKEFDIILIVNYLAESIVLMRRYLNWDLQDVLFIKRNAYSQLREETQRKLNDRIFVNESMRDLHKKWAYLDYALYDFFVKRLQEKIAKEGQGFREEVRHFEHVRNRVEFFCTNVSKPYRANRLKIPASIWNSEFIITNTNCSRFFLPESEFLLEIRRWQDTEI